MTRTRFTATVGMAAVLGVVAPFTVATQSTTAVGPMREFHERIAAYMKLHHEIESPLQPLRANSDASQIQIAVSAMAKAMRSARANARRGDIFSSEIATALRIAIANVLGERGYVAAEVLAAINEEIAPGPLTLAINEPLTSGLATMPPAILQALPDLPSELQYSFVGADLVLLDIHSNLVVDVLPDAILIDRK
jgi:hypothetical protein